VLETKGENFMLLEENGVHENGRENSRVKNSSPSRIKNKRKTNPYAEKKMKIQMRNRKFLGNDTPQSC